MPIVGDAKEVIRDLIDTIKADQAAGDVADYAEWVATATRAAASGRCMTATVCAKVSR